MDEYNYLTVITNLFMLPSKPSKRRHLKNVLMFAVLAAVIGFVGATAVTTATVYAD